MCSHTTTCALILLCVLILVDKRPHTTMCPHTHTTMCPDTPELPAAFNEKIDMYAKEEALVFDGLDFMAVSGSSLL